MVLGSMQPKDNSKAWRKQEARAKRVVPLSQVTRGSGCSQIPTRKSDIVGNVFRAECKTKNKLTATFSVKRTDLDKIQTEALNNHQRPLYIFGWQVDDSTRQDWYAFQESDAQIMMQIVEAVKRGDMTEAERLGGFL